MGQDDVLQIYNRDNKNSNNNDDKPRMHCPRVFAVRNKGRNVTNLERLQFLLICKKKKDVDEEEEKIKKTVMVL